MAFVAAATSVGAAVLGTGAAAGIGSTLVGGALIGAGIGGAYSAITGDGNILNSMLTGGLIGGAGAGLGSAFGLGAKTAAGGASGLTPAAAAAAPSTVAAPTANVLTTSPAIQAAALDAAAVAEGGTTAGMVGAANTGLPANTVLPASMTFTPPAPPPTSGLTGKEMLGYGLAGSAALSLLGGRNQPKIQGGTTTPSYIRPYTYTSTPTAATGTYPSPYATAEYDEDGNPILDTRERDYFTQTYTAQQPYQAAKGGLMAAGGPVERMSGMDMTPGMYPQGMMDKTYYATPSQRPASMEVVKSDYDAPVNPVTGLPPVRFSDGGETSQQIAQQPAMTLDEYIKTQVLPKAPGSANAYTYDPVKQQYSQGLPALDTSAIPAGFNPLVVQAYQAENPNQFRYDPVKQRYSTPMPTQDQYGSYLSDLERRNQEIAQQSIGFGGPLGFSGYAAGGQAGGEYNLGSYSDGGRLLKGPGDGMSDNIPATIGKRQPARLADGEFVVPADVVSHLGNGSTDAGAKRLYSMMDKVRKARTGNKKQGKQIKAEKFIPV